MIEERELMRRLRARGLNAEQMAQWLSLQSRESFARGHLTDAQGRPWQARGYQRHSLESRAERKVHCDGRDVGKTTEIEIMACWAMVTQPECSMLIAAQCENHLFPLLHRIARRFECTPDFGPSLIEVRRTPSWFFRFSNGFTLWGRIAGPRGVNFQGMHVDFQIVDEAQEMTETSWGELYQALNGGGRRWVYGVPNGLRNTFYRMTEMGEFEQYRWPSALNPEFSAAKEEELAQLYGGRTSPGYIHRVLGEHGAPAHAVFNLDDYLACVDEGLGRCDLSLEEGDRLEAPSAPAAGDYYLGCDLGYARDPSEFVVYRAAPPHLVHVLRVHLAGVNYARQLQAIQTLDGAYRFRGIGIDCGNNGRAIAHQLMALGADWCDKVRAFEFGASIDLAPNPDGSPVRRRVKEFMTELLQRHLTEHTIVFPNSPDREMQYAGHTYAESGSGLIVYTKGHDHIIDADRCAVLAHYLDTEDWNMARPPIGVEVISF